MKKLNRTPFILTMVMLLLSSCSKKQLPLSSSKPKMIPQSLRLNITQEPQTLDPRKVSSLGDINLIKMFNEGLTRVDKNGNASLALAKDVKVSNNGLTYTFTLQNSKWSNGDSVTSYDFAYAWKKSLTPTFDSPSSPFLYIIKNAEAIKTGRLPTSLLGIETPNPHELIVHLNEKTPYLLELIEHPIFFPVNEKFDRINPKWAENKETHLANGPFKIEDWKHHHLIEATKNPSYWDAKTVKIETLTLYMVTEEVGLKMFGVKEVDWHGSPFSMIPLHTAENLRESHQLQSSPILGTSWILINTDKPPFHSKKLRHALALAINRQGIIDHLTNQGNQIPATGIVPKIMGLQDIPYFEDGQVDEASRLFEEGLLELGMSKEHLSELTLTYVSNEHTDPICQTLQQQWKEVFNIDLKLNPIESQTYINQVSRQDYTLCLGGWFANFNDPINFLEVFKAKGNGINHTNWENPSYVKLLETSYHCHDPLQRLSYLKQSEQLIMDEMPVIPIFYDTLTYVKDEKLQNVVLTKTGHIDFKWAELNK